MGFAFPFGRHFAHCSASAPRVTPPGYKAALSMPSTCNPPPMSMIATNSLRSVYAVAALSGTLLFSAGCDNYQDVVVIGNDIFVVNFSFDGGDLDVSDDGTIGSYHRSVSELNSDVADDGAVLLYGDGELLFGSGGSGTWTALPVTVGVDEDGDEYIDYSLTYSYSYDIQDLYVDLIASSPLDFSGHARTDFRLVLIPGNLYVGNARAGIDYSNYDAVMQAYGAAE